MIRISIIVMSLMVWQASHAQDISEKEIQKSINFEQLEHPYLLFSKTNKLAIQQRIQHDPESVSIWNKLLAEANMLLYKPVDPTIPSRGTHIRAGWSEEDLKNAYAKKLGQYTNDAVKLAFVYQMTGDHQYAKKAYEFTEAVCRMPLWTIQAHEFDIIYTRVWPWNVDDDQVNFSVDIGSAIKGQYLGWVYDWLYDALSKDQRDRIKGALLEKVITPVRGDYEFQWWANAYRCNWVGVCNGGVGIAALALIKDYPQLSDVVAESYNRINKMMNELGMDGGWQEGGSYWKYGLDHSILFAHSLNKLTADRYNLFENKKLKSNPVAFPIYLFVPPDRSVDFGDSHDSQIGGTSFFNLLASGTQSNEAAWYRQNMLGGGTGYLDLIFPRPQLEPKAPEVASRHFRSIDWWVMRSDFTNPDQVVLAGKAGKNDDPHHGHLDIGHFSLFWKGVAFLKDSGRPYYDEEYFDEYRWQYPQSTSGGHNTILVNGEQQVPGKLKNQPFDTSVGGEVVQFSTSQSRDYVLMDPSNAYERKELKMWKRHVILEKPDNISFVLDEVVTMRPNAQVQVRFHSEVDPEINERYVLLHAEEGTLALIPLLKESFRLQAGKHAYQPIHGQKQFEWLPYFEMVMDMGSRSSTQVATLIVHVSGSSEVISIIESISSSSRSESHTYAFSYRGKPYKFSFEDKKEGLRLSEQ